MHESGGETPMVHYECYTCHISATCVFTPSADLAWLDHMETHAVRDNFGRWTWTAVALPYD